MVEPNPLETDVSTKLTASKPRIGTERMRARAATPFASPPPLSTRALSASTSSACFNRSGSDQSLTPPNVGLSASVRTPDVGVPDLPTSPMPWRTFSFHFLSPTTEMDVGAAVYDSTYPRVFSLEYLLGLSITTSVCFYGFVVLKVFCARTSPRYATDLDTGNRLLAMYGSKGYDDLIDQQWSGFAIQFGRFLAVAALLGAGSRLLRSFSISAPSAAAVGNGANRTVAAEVWDPATVAELPLVQIPSLPYRQTPTAPGPQMRLVAVDLLISETPRRSSRFPVRLLQSLSVLRVRLRLLLAQPTLLPVFYTIVGVIFMAIVHGPHFFLPLLLILANYAVFTRLQRGCPYWVFMALMWAAHVALLYTIERHAGFEDAYWLQYYFPTSALTTRRVLGRSHVHPGLWHTHMRWFIAFRMTTLRLIAFNYDCWEAAHRAARARERAADRHDTACVECAQLREQNANANANANASRAAAAAVLPAEASRCYKYRTEHARDTADYGLANYLAYVVFPPLYLAGPMSSFNAFVSYMRVPSTAMPPRKMAVYALRILGLYLTEYVLMHFIHVAVIGRRTVLILDMTLTELAFYLYFTLAYLWLKFSFIWKSSRLFAMMSGIEVPEDMRRCFSNTLSIRDFWRDWHASFNLWIVRYMYVPLGGRARVALSIMPIFLFIALWHDPALHLLKWALCIAAMFVVELAVCACFSGVVDVFRRAGEEAVEAQGSTEERDGAGDGRGTPPRSPRAVTRAAAPPLVVVLRPAARLAARRLTARARAWAYRLLRVLGGMCTIFGLIVANLIGFSMQNAEATIQKAGGANVDTDADMTISRAVLKLTPSVSLGIVLFLLGGSILSVIDRDMEAAKQVWLKNKYGLK